MKPAWSGRRSISAGRPSGCTFDRDLAIRRTDAEFLALGHPVINAMLEYAGSYDFGGLTACRQIAHAKLKGRAGYQFLFIIRQRIALEGGNECLFHFHPVFVNANGKVDEEAGAAAVCGQANEGNRCHSLPSAESFFQTARSYLEENANLWDWDEDVEFLGLSWVEFVCGGLFLERRR